ncbi:hypothetical protein BD01_0026 [Thermococcus nautili]|uniref:Uncharacterized protein n=1 Tax=Thermococcus nautili TaxID=195522 RepID=W8PHQ7_9EURY|nr:hypothetical protein BD01_0026 [Thermococcus nautili]
MRLWRAYSIRGLLKKGIIGLGLYTVRGRSLVPLPPAKITAFILHRTALLYHSQLKYFAPFVVHSHGCVHEPIDDHYSV